MDWRKASCNRGKNTSKTAIFVPASLQFRGLRPRHIGAREATHAQGRVAGAAHVRIGQDRRHQSRLARRNHWRAMAESVSRAGLNPELASRAKFGDVEIDFQYPRFWQHEIDPQRQRELEYLADHTAARPQKQVLCYLLGDGRAAANDLAIAGIVDRLAQRTEINAVVAAEFRVFGRNHRARQPR